MLDSEIKIGMRVYCIVECAYYNERGTVVSRQTPFWRVRFGEDLLYWYAHSLSLTRHVKPEESEIKTNPLVEWFEGSN